MSKAGGMNEIFTYFSKKDLIKAWRTLKAESGSRLTTSPYGTTDDLRTLMNRMEERTVDVTKRHRIKCLHKSGMEVNDD